MLSTVVHICVSCQVERIQFGEEVDYHFVAATMKEALDQWNFAVQKVKSQAQDPKSVLQLMENVQLDDGAGVEDALQRALDEIKLQVKSLKFINLKETDTAFLSLA